MRRASQTRAKRESVVSKNIDQRYMAATIRYARQNISQTRTNPSVGCLIVQTKNDQSRIVGRGVTALGGRPHAEPVALLEAGKYAAGATAYVTLEPCAHHGATPSCAQTLIDAGIARVVTGWDDPDSRVDGKGHAMLRDAGIEVVTGVLAEEARDDLGGYLTRKQNNRPWVTLKLAVSKDGFIGREDEGQVAITGKIARAQVDMMRAVVTMRLWWDRQPQLPMIQNLFVANPALNPVRHIVLYWTQMQSCRLKAGWSKAWILPR